MCEEVNVRPDTWKTDTLDELLTLNDKIARLAKTLRSDRSQISKEQQELLERQLDCMCAYAQVLKARLYAELK